MIEYDEYLEDDDDLIDLVLGDATEPEIHIYSGAKLGNDVLDENVIVHVTKKGAKIKMLLRDKEGGGSASNVSTHAPSMKLVDGKRTLSIRIRTDDGKNYYAEQDPHNNPRLERELKKEFALTMAFANKNAKDLSELWNCKNDTEGEKIARKIERNNPEYQFSIVV